LGASADPADQDEEILDQIDLRQPVPAWAMVSGVVAARKTNEASRSSPKRARRTALASPRVCSASGKGDQGANEAS